MMFALAPMENDQNTQHIEWYYIFGAVDKSKSAHLLRQSGPLQAFSEDAKPEQF